MGAAEESSKLSERALDSVHVNDVASVYEVAAYLLRATNRSTVINIGCDTGHALLKLGARRRIGIDDANHISRCKSEHGEKAEWYELAGVKEQFLALTHVDALVLCIVRPSVDLKELLALLSASRKQGALILIAMPAISGEGPNTVGKLDSVLPQNYSSLQKFVALLKLQGVLPKENYSLQEFVDRLNAQDMPPTYSGYIPGGIGGDHTLPIIMSIHDPAVDHAAKHRAHHAQRPLAILTAYNENDIIAEVMDDWLQQGCDLAVVDNWSNDGTWGIIERFRRDHPDRVESHRFPVDEPSVHYEWQKILHRKEEIAAANPDRWIIHTDADEIRRSPFPGTTIAEGLEIASYIGANRVNFSLINFRPINDQPFIPGTLKTNFTHFEFGTRPGHFKQCKAWIQGAERVNLAASGGHIVDFPGARDFPYRFLLRHYPIRSKAHGAKKIFTDRRLRWSPYERGKLGWHTHYDEFSNDSEFVWSPAELISFDEDFWNNYGLYLMTDLLQRQMQVTRPSVYPSKVRAAGAA